MKGRAFFLQFRLASAGMNHSVQLFSERLRCQNCPICIDGELRGHVDPLGVGAFWKSF